MEIPRPKVLVINCTDRKFTEIQSLYQSVADALGVSECRLQIGSYSCGNYVLAMMQQTEILPGNVEYDLVIPEFSESQLEQFRKRERIPLVQCARQIVVNDFGALHYFYDRKDIRLGRMMFPDYRDHRYPEYENTRHQAGNATLLAALSDLGYSIAAVENDLITKHSSLETTQNTVVYYHVPYRQISSAHICEYASIGKRIERKFIPDDSCSFQCFDIKIRQKRRINGTQYFKVGKNVFDRLDAGWLSPEQAAYVIYTPEWFL